MENYGDERALMDLKQRKWNYWEGGEYEMRE